MRMWLLLSMIVLTAEFGQVSQGMAQSSGLNQSNQPSFNIVVNEPASVDDRAAVTPIDQSEPLAIRPAAQNEIFRTNAQCGESLDPAREKNQVERPDKLTVTVGDVLIRIDGPKLWTLSGVDFQKSTMAVQESAYGTVLNLRGVGALGSAHFLDIPGKPGMVEKEHVSRLQLFVNDQSVSEVTSTMELSGKSFRIRRESTIRDVMLTSTVTLRDGVLIESARLQTSKTVDLKVVYPLMYAWSSQMTDYVFGDANGIQKQGKFIADAGKSGEGVERTANWMGVYNAAQGRGAVLLITQQPQVEPAVLQFTDAPGIYRKVRLMTFVEKVMPPKYDGTFEVAVGFFTAPQLDWHKVALKRVHQLRPDSE